MSVADIPILLEIPGRSHGRSRSNLTSQVVLMPHVKHTTAHPLKRNLVQYFVTLAPLNDTFINKHLSVAIFPETTKLGRPTGTRHKPDVTNGYFDLRVLSRNHAQMFIDPNLGKLMIQDLGSSNGTYVNDVRLGQDPVEIKIGSNVCLGFNVQQESTHKQISLRVENINVVRHDYSLTLFPQLQQLNTPQFKHLNFIEDIYRRVMDDHHQSLLAESTFDVGLFGDVNPAVEDDLLGLFSGTNTGIYNNLAITNSLTFEQVIATLIAALGQIKQQNETIASLNQFLSDYHAKLNNLNGAYLDRQLQRTVEHMENELSREKLATKKLDQRFRDAENDHQHQVELLTNRIRELEQDLHVTKLAANGSIDLLLLREMPNGLFSAMDSFQFLNGEMEKGGQDRVSESMVESPLPPLPPEANDLSDFFSQVPLVQVPPNRSKRVILGDISPVVSRLAPEEFPLTLSPVEEIFNMALEAPIEDEKPQSQTMMIAVIALIMGYLIQKIT